jgi:hypothetical protein
LLGTSTYTINLPGAPHPFLLPASSTDAYKGMYSSTSRIFVMDGGYFEDNALIGKLILKFRIKFYPWIEAYNLAEGRNQPYNPLA